MELSVEKCNVVLGASFFSSLFGCCSIIRSALPTICADDCWYAAKDFFVRTMMSVAVELWWLVKQVGVLLCSTL